MIRRRGAFGGRILIALGVVVLLVVAVLGSWFWLRDGGGEERNAFCWSLVPGGEPEGGGSTAECGDALERAMTGRPPGTLAPEEEPEHGGEQVRVFQQVVGGYADHAMPSEISRNMANALTHYAGDVHGVLAELRGESAVDVSRKDLILFLREVFVDEKSFQAVYEGQAAQIAEKLQELGRDDFTRFPRGATDRAAGTVMESGAVVGTLTQIRMAVLSGPEEENDAVARKARIDLYSGYGRPRLERMVQDRALEAGVPGEEISESGSRSALLLGEVGQSYTAAARATEGVLLR